MPPTPARVPMSRPRSRKAPLATLLAICAVATGALALAPAGASAMTSTESGTKCYLAPGSETSGRTASGQPCSINLDGSGGEVIEVTGKLPTFVCRTCLPDLMNPRLNGSPDETPGYRPRGGSGVKPGKDGNAPRPKVRSAPKDSAKREVCERAKRGELVLPVQELLRHANSHLQASESRYLASLEERHRLIRVRDYLRGFRDKMEQLLLTENGRSYISGHPLYSHVGTEIYLLGRDIEQEVKNYRELGEDMMANRRTFTRWQYKTRDQFRHLAQECRQRQGIKLPPPMLYGELPED